MYGAGQLKSTVELVGDRVIAHDAAVCVACWVTFSNATSMIPTERVCRETLNHQPIKGAGVNWDIQVLDKKETRRRNGNKRRVGNHHQYCGCGDESGLTVTQLPYANPSR